MDEDLLEIRRYDGEGYRPLIDFNSWRVAILRWMPGMQPEATDRMERHTQTDEVFVLLEGKATLILGGNTSDILRIRPQMMENGILYNVKQNVWHSVLLSRDATILIVEERDTGERNTEYYELTSEFRKEIIGFLEVDDGSGPN
jgi:ureidoglycolate hydrolase